MSDARVLGIVGWSGSGKTTLITQLIPYFLKRGVLVATLKHAHHGFDVDQPGKDSYEHRKAGAREVIVSSSRRWVQMHEVADGREATLAQLLRRVSVAGLVLVEGFKSERHPKLEIYRQAVGKPTLYPEDACILGVASDGAVPGAPVPVIDLNDIASVSAFILEHAQPMAEVLAVLEDSGRHP